MGANRAHDITQHLWGPNIVWSLFGGQIWQVLERKGCARIPRGQLCRLTAAVIAVATCNPPRQSEHAVVLLYDSNGRLPVADGEENRFRRRTGGHPYSGE